MNLVRGETYTVVLLLTMTVKAFVVRTPTALHKEIVGDLVSPSQFRLQSGVSFDHDMNYYFHLLPR